ncbi:hypothetical protein A5624_10610 [Mycobacterium sp. 1482292.6]|uniref:PE family protein n=1 Tax=unclassified Mycobacterium TaxID=2642494 RepID=UPI0007FE4225|nr:MULTISPECIES: PE domain-containing protein [unclassified Mycobacterium]OBJ12690.1 hypothetical protein A5624_10610 [Mycobacterium sp. 1482292.6]OBJ24815.1 hypothetical protein A5622_11210 [Mycobacterium sp. 1245801.1]
MTSTADLRMQPADLVNATQGLDQLASRAENLMEAEAPNLAVAAPARDEVSQRVASTLNNVHADFRELANQGANAIRQIAATLRAQTDNIVGAEQDFAV